MLWHKSCVDDQAFGARFYGLQPVQFSCLAEPRDDGGSAIKLLTLKLIPSRILVGKKGGGFFN